MSKAVNHISSDGNKVKFQVKGSKNMSKNYYTKSEIR